MGIYPYRRITEVMRHPDGREIWLEVETEPGIIRRRKVTADPWDVERTDCFCCSCSDWGGSDPYCRNHGFAAERPCEVHQMPGTPNEAGVMPESVQAERARLKALQ